MVDTVSPEQRSYNMSLIRSKDTKPEVFIRSLLHRLGFRFRKNVKNLPGKPDIVLPKYKSVIFVHGCFWHQHKKCKRSNIPKSNMDFWKSKLNKNVKRDTEHQAELKKAGWKIKIVWECELKNLENLKDSLIKFLRPIKRT